MISTPEYADYYDKIFADYEDNEEGIDDEEIDDDAEWDVQYDT